MKSYPPKAHFLKEHILGPRGATPSNFYTRYNNRLTSALHTGDGGPLTIFVKRVKVGSKCNKGALITSELGGVVRRNFDT